MNAAAQTLGRFAVTTRRIAAVSSALCALLLAAVSRADVFDNVGEAVDYELVYSLEIPNAANQRVRFVDQYPNFVNPNGTIKSALLPDGVHPNQTGYDLMADTWSSAILTLPLP